MRQASWNEMFAPREEPEAFAGEVPEEPRGWRRLLWWEDLVTFALLGIVFLSVVGSINSAGWVDDMPSLYPIAFLGLLMGTLLARLRWPEGLVHLLALPAGAAAVFVQILAVVPGGSPLSRYQELAERMDAWFGIAFGGGISNDDLPFIVLLVALSWLAAYLSAWAVFRWQNAWLALIPGGWAILMNISYLPGQFSYSFVFYLFAAVLLVARLNVLGRAAAWRRQSTPYPSYLSLSVLHATFWAVLLLLGLAWLLPQANQAGALEGVWNKATAPLTEPFEGLGRLFAGVNSPQVVRIHNFGDSLPFQGSVSLPDTLVLDVATEELDQPRYLRERVFDIYTPTGWRSRAQQELPLEAFVITTVDQFVERRGTITVEIVVRGRAAENALTIGQPRRIDRDGTLRWSRVRSDVLSLEIEGGLEPGSFYEAVGSISVASEEELRAAGSDYPAWVELNYLQLPGDFPARVRELASELTRSRPTPYDQATAIEDYLRTIPYDLDVPSAPFDRDAVEFFLFQAERGYFDYHASAMVVMLRSVGVPSRLAVGYVLQEDDLRDGRYRVTEQSAYAWPEVFFPGLGWVEFNPTPGLPLIVRPGTVEPIDAASGDGSTPAGGSDQELNFEDLAGLSGEEGSDFALPAQNASSDRNRWVVIALVAALAALIAVTAGGARFAWAQGLGGLTTPERLWGQTVRLASWARLRPRPAQTPREYARSLRDEAPEIGDVDQLADAYVRHRYGRKPTDGDERRRLEETWRAVRGRLLRRLFRLR